MLNEKDLERIDETADGAKDYIRIVLEKENWHIRTGAICERRYKTLGGSPAEGGSNCIEFTIKILVKDKKMIYTESDEETRDENPFSCGSCQSKDNECIDCMNDDG